MSSYQRTVYSSGPASFTGSSMVSQRRVGSLSSAPKAHSIKNATISNANILLQIDNSKLAADDFKTKSECCAVCFTAKPLQHNRTTSSCSLSKAPFKTQRLLPGRQMQFMLLFSRQGKLRLQKWYVPLSDTQKKKISREVIQMVLARKPKMCSFLEWRDLKIVYKRYASLYFCCAVEDQENELITLEIIHRYVELLDKYFGSVCELDIIFNFEKAYYILDEFILGGEAQETSKKIVLKAIEQADMLQEEAEAPRSVLEEIGLT
ncbi:AP-1 complex subunit sigma-2 [Bagarius yarrelli]|uniref:AP-1 complex subunit sigma-2 n=4 Tax=Otophysi TaxID=186626 RepID=A0A556U5V2_BAGYA|nr:AP-1 complex subunit sigma-2 [Bagarius yarrelli]